jgi:undecaprenyl-diphosphatase
MSAHRPAAPPLVDIPRGTLVIALVLWAATFALGFAAKAATGWLASQLAVDRALNAMHSPVFDAVAKGLDRLDSVTVIAVCIALLAVLTGIFVSWGRAVAAVVIAGAGWVLCLIPKAVVGEVRPPLDAVRHRLDVTHATLSYPSGHTVFAVTLTAAVIMVCRGTASRIVATVLGILFVAVTGWSRLYVGAHYPSDIVGGVLAGAAGALLIAWLWNVSARSLLPRFTGAPPPGRDGATAR